MTKSEPWPRIIRAKWLYNDTDTWDGMMLALADEMLRLDTLRKRGYVVVQNNNDDYVFYARRSQVPDDELREWDRKIALQNRNE